MPTVVQQTDVPETIHSLSNMSNHDYVDLFSVTTHSALERSPEEFARMGLEEVAGSAGQFVWRVLCSLRLTRTDSPDYIAGWKIGDRGNHWIRLEASGGFMSANIVMHFGEQELSAATFVRYENRLGEVIWPIVSAGHRRAMPRLIGKTMNLARLRS